jgi:CheY-like chemotaxis protein
MFVGKMLCRFWLNQSAIASGGIWDQGHLAYLCEFGQRKYSQSESDVAYCYVLEIALWLPGLQKLPIATPGRCTRCNAMRDALEGFLRASGLHSGKFSSAEEFLASPDRQGASCLILDVRLPGMSGIELQHLICQMGDSVPIIFLTGHGDAAVRELVMNAGALGYLTKPVRRDVLLEMVWSAMSMRGGSAPCDAQSITTGPGHV